MKKEKVAIASGDLINGQSLVVVKSEGKLEKLNELQLQHMHKIKQFWLDYIFSCKNSINKDQAITGIEWLYKLAGYDKPIIIFLDSPMACQYGTHILKQVFKKDSLAQVRAQVWAQVGDQVRAQVGDQVRDQVWDQVWDQVRAQVREEKLSFESFSSYGSVRDWGWVSFYDFFTQIGVINHEGFNAFRNLLLSGIYDMIQLNGFCIVSQLPTKIIRNPEGRLHNPNGPAIEFRDGYAQYYVNGRALPSWIWEKAAAGEITKEMFLKEQNSEIKGGIYEVLGQTKMLELLGAKLVDERVITHKNGDLETVSLLKTEERFPEIDNQPFAWVKMVCPSTGTQYLQGVEPHHTDALSAIASLSPFKPEEYSFDMRA